MNNEEIFEFKTKLNQQKLKFSLDDDQIVVTFVDTRNNNLETNLSISQISILNEVLNDITDTIRSMVFNKL